MSDNKKYYYLKLKDDFFDTDEIKILEDMENGYKYSNILLKMYLKSLKKEGLLMFKNSIPFSPKMISTVTGHNINDVKQALQLFQQLDLIEVLSNGAIYMMDIQNYIGTSSTEADRIRAYRNEVEKKKKQLLENTPEEVDPGIFIDGKTGDVTNVQQMYDKSTPEKEIEKELSKSKDNKDREEAVPYQKIKKLYNNICGSELKSIRKMSNHRKKHLKARWKEEKGNIEVFEELFNKTISSNFLTGDNDRNWKADFDWLIKNDTNFNKVLEGQYNKETSKKDLPADEFI